MSASKSSTLPIWDGMIDCWSGYTAHALEYVQAGQPAAYGQGRIHIHWGILWGSRPVLFQLSMLTSARGSNNWTPSEYNSISVAETAPLSALSVPEQWQALGPVLDLYRAQWHTIDQLVDSGEWVPDTHLLKNGSVDRRECPAHRITRSLEHLFETGALDLKLFS